MPQSAMHIAAAILFALAVLHTFATKHFERLAHLRPAHSGLWHLLGEVEAVFGFWSLVLVACQFALEGSERTLAYVDSRNMTEPLFVFAVMVISGSRPVLQAVGSGVLALARALPLPGSTGFFLCVLTVVPLLGSFITEPAAMTLAALLLSDRIYARGASARLKYATLGALFVNISIGGTMTPFAAPPILMVAAKWGWDLPFMFVLFGWKAALAVVVNGVGTAFAFRRELAALKPGGKEDGRPSAPAALVAVHLLFLLGVVVFAHHPVLFMGLFLFFLGVATAYKRHQDRLILKEGLLVAFFLAGLVVLGGMQQWWLKPLLLGMGPGQVFAGAAALTAVTDNAALTYLGSLVEGLSEGFKYALVAGAVTGGGLTIIANAPNPAGASILRAHFPDQAIHPLGLLASALPPTAVAAAAFLLL